MSEAARINEAELLATPDAINDIVAIAPVMRSTAQTHKIRTFFLATAAPPWP